MSIDEIDEVETWLEGRDLLGRALEGVSAPAGGGTRGTGGTEAVFARAARLRRRRWGGATVVVAAAVAAGAVVGPGWLTYDEAGPNVGTAQPAGEATEDAARFAKLLPAGIGEIREVDLRPGDFFWTPEYVQTGRIGPYQGDYSVSRDGGVGYLRVDGVFSKSRSKGWANPCTWRPDAAKDWSNSAYVLPYNREKNCTFERLPNGNVLEFRESLDHLNVLTATNKIQTWDTYLSATLYLKSGGYVQVDDATGFTGTDSLGRPLDELPLIKSQLRELVLSPKLLLKAKD
ncbi:hypothetical protein RB628_04740 [Streptomyces sp. ADMS]|uniref:hypothetical protein n=1 Tax=Streptomyces sp. ADMS TaxID=3071415 RepID=UPI00296F79B6|nr:hypothetical protein [Streptomyces sp. ADMS]MDW4904669.1 hypothetical protein [Streptomyces sp. ADMS]